MNFPSELLIPWLPFQVGVLPTGWPPFLAPKNPQVFESILASSLQDVASLATVLPQVPSTPHLHPIRKALVPFGKRWQQKPVDFKKNGQPKI